jgi:hypothetical protein
MTFTLPPPVLLTHQSPVQAIQQQGFAVLTAQQLAQQSGVMLPELMAWRSLWSDLPPDRYLRDGGRYRRRRHACFIVEQDQSMLVPHRPHWQPVEYNALHGGMERHFEPMNAAMVHNSHWQQLLVWLGRISSELWSERPWYTEAHQFRIDTTDGIGRPTPEGAHRDGVDLVAVFLVDRQGVKGGETRVFDATGPQGQRFTLVEPWSLLLLDDARVIHESTPIQPVAAAGYRDTLVITLRSGCFQGAESVNAPSSEYC